MPRRKKKSLPHPIVMQLAIIAKIDGRTPLELAKIDGISHEAWYSWLRGDRDPTFGKLITRANTLGKDLFLGDQINLKGPPSDQTTQHPGCNLAPTPRWPDHDRI